MTIDDLVHAAEITGLEFPVDGDRGPRISPTFPAPQQPNPLTL